MDNEVFDNYAELVARFKSGDESAYEELYEKTKQFVYTTCLGILRNDDDAFDAMQDTYLTVYRRIDSLEDDKTFISWLKRIATTKSLDLYKKRKGDVSYDDAVAVDESLQLDDDLESLPDSYIMEKTKREALDKIIKESLSDVQYQTIHMHYYGELSVETIAELMECPVGTVKTRLMKSRAKIKEGVKKYEKDNKDAFAAVPAPAVPFLTRFFRAGAEDVTVPPLDVSSLIGTESVSAVSNAAKAAKGTAKTAKNIKLIAGAAALALVVAGAFGVKKVLDRQESVDIPPETSAVVSETTPAIETTESLEVINPFDYIIVHFGGNIPDEGTASISRYTSCPEGLEFEISQTTGLNNGDEITVTVVSAPEVEGCVYEPMSQTFVVDGLTRLITVSHSETTVAFNDYGYRTLQISVPEVSISGIDMTETNNALYELCSSEMTSSRTQYNNGTLEAYDYNYQYIDFLSYCSDDVISIILIGTDRGKDHMGPMYTYEVINISAQTGSILSDDELLEILGMNDADFRNYVTEALNDDLGNLNYGNPEQADELENMVGMSPMEFNTLTDRVAQARPYVSNSGSLCFVYELAFIPDSMAGYSYYFMYKCIDPAMSQMVHVRTEYVDGNFENAIEGLSYSWDTY